MPDIAPLAPHATLSKPDAPVLVCILDGWGENKVKDEYNAVHVAETPTTDALKDVPGRWRTVRAHGTAVGLPSDADMGNSEVGHNALGANWLRFQSGCCGGYLVLACFAARHVSLPPLCSKSQFVVAALAVLTLA